MTVPILETTDVICSSLYLRAAQDRINHSEGKQWCGVCRFCASRIKEHQSILWTPQISLQKLTTVRCSPTG
jgi:hypothetical protein